MDNQIFNKNVYFKDENAKGLWEDFVHIKPIEACEILIGRNAEHLSEINKSLKEAIDRMEGFEHLSDDDKKKAISISAAIDKYSDKIKSGELQLNEKHQKLMNILSDVVVAPQEAKALIDRGQELANDIELLSKIREELIQQNAKSNTNNERNQKDNKPRGVDRD